MIKFKGWLVFSEPNAPSPKLVVWEKPPREFLTVWKTKAIPVTVQAAKKRKTKGR